MDAAIATADKSPTLSGFGVRGALAVGALRVISARDRIDRINVFPVPDGDTGTNLAFTFGAVLDGLEKQRSASVAEVLRGAAFHAIDGARGNSGAILAQFFTGLAQAVGERTRIDLGQLAQALEQAAQSARSALAEPREGTILSVISAFARSSRQALARGGAGLREWLQTVLAGTEKALERTESQLEVLRKAQVVDAGALGFVEFLRGVGDFVQRGRKALLEGRRQRGEPLELEAMAEVHAEVEAGTRRYCSECLVRGTDIDAEALRQRLRTLPLDSLVVVGGGARARVHAHIDDPAVLFRAAAGFGEVVQRKADDMWTQARARASHRPAAVVLDSAADLPPAERERLGIHVVPVRINFGAEEYLDGITLSADELFERMRQGETPRTSQPPAGEFRRLYTQLASHHQGIVSVQLSSRLSGTWQAARAAAQHGGNGKVHVVDTRNASAGQALLALHAAELAERGLSAAAIAEALRASIDGAVTYAVLPELTYACRGGRLPAWMAPVARALGLVIEIGTRGDGRIGLKGAFLAGSDWVGRFTRRMVKRLAGWQRPRLIVADCLNPEAADRLEAGLRAGLPGLAELHRVRAGTALGAHAGPGALIVGAMEAR